MERWSGLGTRQKIAVTVGVSAGAALLYVWYYRRRAGPQRGDPELHMDVPRSAAELILGQDGALSDQLTRSGAQIEMAAAPDGGGDRKLTIRGAPEQVRQAQQLLHGILQGGATVRAELHYPSASIGRIIGKDGDRIREMTKRSGALIVCERRPENRAAASQTRRITVTGTWEQVAAAKTLLHAASEEVAAVQRRAAESSTFRSHRKELIAVKRKDRQRPPEDGQRPPPTAAPQTNNSPQDSDAKADVGHVSKFEVPSPDFSFRADEYVDVYVSAAENPAHFWIQILGSRSSQLDKLTTEMSEHYRRQERGAVPEIQVGDIVAAPFHGDDCWYRAEVLGFLEDGNVDLYYVDYGDNGGARREELHPLRSDFLSLPFQAIECRLSGVAPRGSWSDEALDAFESLSYCAEWRPLLAKISSFPSPGVSHCFQIRLYDPSRDPVMDIALELIRRGLAVECQTSPIKVDEDEALVSRLLEEVIHPSVQSEHGSFSIPDGSIEMVRADVNPDPLQSVISSPSSCLESVEEADSLEQSISNLRLNGSDRSLTTSSSTSSSTKSSISSAASSGSSSTCTASEGPSFMSSSLEDSSVYSPRGCFYYLTDEASTSSIFTSSSGDVITISSDSEEDAGTIQTDGKKAAKDSDVSVSSSSEVIVIED